MHVLCCITTRSGWLAVCRYLDGSTVEAAAQLAGALDVFRSALKLDPRVESRAQLGIGVALELTNDLDGAVDAYSRVVELNPRDADGWVRLCVWCRAGYVESFLSLTLWVLHGQRIQTHLSLLTPFPSFIFPSPPFPLALAGTSGWACCLTSWASVRRRTKPTRWPSSCDPPAPISPSVLPRAW